MFAVVIPTEMTTDQPFNHADLRLDSLEQIPLAEMIERVGGEEKAGNAENWESRK